MKNHVAAAFVAVLALGACETSNTSQPATVVDPLIGKQLVSENGTVFLFNPDGTMGGKFRDKAIIGTYEADANEVCSTYTAPEPLAGNEYCSAPQIEGDTVVFNRRDGTKSQLYKIGG